MNQLITFIRTTIIIFLIVMSAQIAFSQNYKIVDTNQTTFYDNSNVISTPALGDASYGQDAQYSGYQPSYTDNGDGTITDNVTGLMWQKSADLNGDGNIDADDKLTYDEALAGASSFNLAGYTDWRFPSIKEAYSLILFSGEDISGFEGTSAEGFVPFIDTDYFEFGYGDLSANERLIDAQFATTTKYVSTTMNGQDTMFGTNLADGRIKGYGLMMGPVAKTFYVLYVRENTDYGINDFSDNGDGTITDNATGLMWKQDDSGEGMLWENALSYAENYEYAGYSDWRLPNAKELQSIIDYTRSPATSNSAAIDPLFNCTQITNEGDVADYPYFWSSTTHASWRADHVGEGAAYLSFGRAMGYMNSWMDVHGAGAQRSDPKTGDPDDYPTGHGPQGDAIRIYNYVRLVRGVSQTVPVEFYGFNASQHDGNVILSWSTASESNNLGFDVERSYDKKTFTKIAFIKGQGTISITSGYEFVDENVKTGYLYYRIKQIDFDGQANYSTVLEVVISSPKKYSLSQNYPNPFNPSTTISFSLPAANHVSLKIYDLRGKQVAELVDGRLNSGTHLVEWQAKNLPSGIFYYILKSGSYSETKKMILLR